MRSRTAFVSVAVVVLAFAGCGGTNKTATTETATTAATNPPLPPPRQVIPASYSANLATFNGIGGLKGGAPNASGVAVINVNPPDQICWQFSQLKNVTAPTVARVYRSFPGGSGINGFPLGRHYKPSGCARVPASSALLKLLEANPQEWYVSIHTAQYPGGALRGPA